MIFVMRITLLVAVAGLLAGCAGAEEMVGTGSDAGTMMAQTGTGGTAGAGGYEPATGGTGGSASTGGSGGSGGSSPAPDAGAPKTDAMMSVDTKPATPMACDSGNHMLYATVCIDPPNTKNGKVLYLDRRPCNICVTVKVDGRTIERQFTGCLAQTGAICVADCSECKPQ
jgi:hypothetical protein